MLNLRYTLQPQVGPDRFVTTVPTLPDETMAAAVVMPTLDEIASVRGLTDTAAESSECACPEYCERDHANE